MKKKIYNFIISFLLISFIFSTNSFAQWLEVNTGTTADYYTISAVNDNVVWLGCIAQSIRKTTDGGLSWSFMDFGNPWHIYSLYAISADTGFVSAVNTTSYATHLLKTSNGGINWDFSNPFGCIITSINMTSSTNGFFIGYLYPLDTRWAFYKTTNAGANWDSLSLYIPKASDEISTPNNMFILGNNIWFTSSYHKIYYSSNLGQTWQTQSPYYIGYNYNPVVWFNSLTLGITNEGPSTSFTTNSGLNWLQTGQQFTSSTNHYYGLLGINTTFWFALDNHIYVTSNYGTNWTLQYTTPLYYYTLMAKSRTGNTGWAIQAGGGLSKYSNLSGIFKSGNDIPAHFSLSQNYPNPFNPSTNIKYQIAMNSYAKLTVYDILGKEVVILVNEKLQPGTYEVNWDASNQPSGVYFYKLQAGNYTETKKMILMK